MTPERAVALSMANILADGLDDVLPEPFEISLLKKTPEIQRKLKTDAVKKMGIISDSARIGVDDSGTIY